MNGTRIQAKVYAGYKKAASKIGMPFTLYRAASASDPLGEANTVATDFMMAVYQDIDFSTPSKYGNAVWRALFDGSISRPGDYISNGDHTYFIQDQPHIVPPTVVECNAIVNVSRVTQPTGKGAVGYGANLKSTEVPLMTGWPASQLIGTKWERNPIAIPGDERLPYWVILLPHFEGVDDIKTSDIIVDNIGRRLVVSAAELTSFGWRINAGTQGA